MSSSGKTVNETASQPWGMCGAKNGRSKARWSALNIAAMVFSFIFFWPLGLVVLFWILGGRDANELPSAIRQHWRKFRGTETRFGSHSDNVVFNDFQQTQFDRINEIKHEIKERAERFKEFKADAQRRADQDEFNRFMSTSPNTFNQ